MSGFRQDGSLWQFWCRLGLGLSLVAAANGVPWAAAQQPRTAAARDRASFRAGLTATLVLAGKATDSTGVYCRLVAVEWRPLEGAASYQVQVSVGARGRWVADLPDQGCGGGGATSRTTFRDSFPYPSPVRFYRVVALAEDGHDLVATEPVPVEVR